MASQTNSYPMETPTVTPPTRLGWWSRPIATFPASHDRNPTFKEFAAFMTPSCAGVFTFIAVMAIFFPSIDEKDCKFAIQSIDVSPSAMWHVDFLVTNPSSSFHIYYVDDETAVRLGPLNAAVLNTSYEPKSSSQIMAFSVDFVAEDNPKDIDSVQLDIKLRTVYKGFFKTHDFNDSGHIDISCHNLTRSHDNVEKIQCYSSLTDLKILRGSYRR